MIRILLLVLAISLFPKHSFSQFFIEPGAGYQIDVNNSKGGFVNSNLQFVYKISRLYEFLFLVQKSWPAVSKTYIDSSFTLNPGLPLYAPAKKTLKSSLSSLAFGNRFKIAGKSSKNSLFISLYAGISFQKISVSYQYDKNNYTVLNPDQTLQKTGLFISAGLGYMRSFNKSRFLFELNIASPPATGKSNYPVSFNLIAPLSFNVLYSIKL